jgi:GT2 family glycosyltransferase
MISAIVPTIGRLDSVNALLASLAAQTRHVDEVIIASADEATCESIKTEAKLGVKCLSVSPAA